MERLPRYCRRCVEAARAVEEHVGLMSRWPRWLRWLPFRVVARGDVESLGQLADNNLDKATLVGVAVRVIANMTGVENGWSDGSS